MDAETLEGDLENEIQDYLNSCDGHYSCSVDVYDDTASALAAVTYLEDRQNISLGKIAQIISNGLDWPGLRVKDVGHEKDENLYLLDFVKDSDEKGMFPAASD